MSEVPRYTRSRTAKTEALLTFFTCLLVGPPIGGLIFALAVAVLPPIASGVTTAASADDQLATGLFIGLFAVPFSYLVGGLQAAAAGLAFAVYGWFRGRPPLWFAALTAAVIYAGAWIGGWADVDEIFWIMMLVHVVPVLLCWLIISHLWWRRPA